MAAHATPESTILVIGILLLITAQSQPNIYISGQLALAQTPNNTTILRSFPPTSFEPLSAQQIASSTNKTCTLTPSLIEIEGTPQQIEGPYFVDGMPNRSDLRSESSDGII